MKTCIKNVFAAAYARGWEPQANKKGVFYLENLFSQPQKTGTPRFEIRKVICLFHI